MNKDTFRKNLEALQDNMKEYPKTFEQLIIDFDDMMECCIEWSVEDFEMQARNMADDEWEEVYDKSKFQDALELMIRKHSAEDGITWNTIGYYLNEYCKIENNE